MSLAAVAAAFILASGAFHPGGRIPKLYTCDGRNVSPPLHWTAPPRRTRALAVSVVDLDAHGFVHWLGWSIPARARGLAAGQHAPREARNGFGRRGYGGPCPPSGSSHRYLFRLYALDSDVGPPFTGHVLAVARLPATYGR